MPLLARMIQFLLLINLIGKMHFIKIFDELISKMPKNFFGQFFPLPLAGQSLLNKSSKNCIQPQFLQLLLSKF